MEAGLGVDEYVEPLVVFVFIYGDVYGREFDSHDGVCLILTGCVDISGRVSG